MSKKLKTVNVIECIDKAYSVTSFEESVEGNQEAEELFVKLARANGAEGVDMDVYIDDCYYENGSYAVIITHSM